MMYAPTSSVATPKTVLFVENDHDIRVPVLLNLEARGFRTLGAPDRASVHELLKKPHQDIDVMILDVSLEDAASHATTGFDLGQEVIDTQPDLPPRRIVYSGHNYYEEAMRIGVDAYIGKLEPESPIILLNSVETSSLVRNLSPVRPEISWKLGQIGEKNLDTVTAVKHICRQVIAPEVKVCLGIPCFFVFSDGTGHTKIIDPQDESSAGDSEDWGRIQAETFE